MLDGCNLEHVVKKLETFLKFMIANAQVQWQITLVKQRTSLGKSAHDIASKTQFVGRAHPDSGQAWGGMEMGKLNAYSLEAAAAAVSQEVSPIRVGKVKERTESSLAIVVVVQSCEREGEKKVAPISMDRSAASKAQSRPRPTLHPRGILSADSRLL